MKKLFIAAFMFVSIFGTKVMADIKMGIILGFTGPIESLTPAMAASAELAFKEASDSGSLLGGKKNRTNKSRLNLCRLSSSNSSS